jgi:hypothetical protein
VTAGFVVGCVFLVTGCAMFSAWRSIPPPGGCDQCHTLPISNNWSVTYQVVALTDERTSKPPYFQTEKYTVPAGEKPRSSLDVLKVEDERCFDCHRSPTQAHRQRVGRYHH